MNKVDLTYFEAYVLYWYCKSKTITEIAKEFGSYPSCVSVSLSNAIDKMRKINFKLWKSVSFCDQKPEVMILKHSYEFIKIIEENGWLSQKR